MALCYTRYPQQPPRDTQLSQDPQKSTNPWDCRGTQVSDPGSGYLCTGLAVVGLEPHVPPCHVVSLAQDGRCHAQVERRSWHLWGLPGPGSADCLALRGEPVHPTHCSRAQWDGRSRQGTEPLGSPSPTPGLHGQATAGLGEPSPAAFPQLSHGPSRASPALFVGWSLDPT